MPFYFDLSNRGFAGDAEAREFVVKARPGYGGRSVPTPNLLIMAADGKLLGEVSNYASEAQVLEKMLEVLRKHPEYNAPGPAEKGARGALARAQVRIDLQDYAGARKELAAAEGDQAQYVLGRLARMERKWEEMEKRFAKVKDAELQDDLRMERAYRLWHDGRFDRLRAHLKDVSEKSNRYTEARYYYGLALFHLKRKEAALEAWKSTITSCSQDPWIYRADWAYTQAKEKGGGRRSFSSAGPRTSLLNRIGYMGRRNPDLSGPR